LAKKTKDLQVAAWLTEALVHREGFAGLKDGLELLRGLVETFWDHVYPEAEDGDLELRAAPLEWVGRYLDVAVKSVPLNEAGHSFIAYKDSRTVPTEDEAESDNDKRSAREEALEEGKLAPESFDESFEATPKAWYKQTIAELDGAREALAALEQLCDEKFGDDAPNLRVLRGALEEVRVLANQLLAKKLETDP